MRKTQARAHRRELRSLRQQVGLVVPRAAGYRFAHGLFQGVIYTELAPELRREMHRRLAEHLEARTPAAVDPERLGLHWERAGLPDLAAPHLRRAALEATRRQEYLRALDLAARAGLSAERIDPATARGEADLLFALAGALSDLGRYPEAEALVQKLLSAADHFDDEVLYLRAVVWRSDFRYWTEGIKSIDEAELVRAEGSLPQCQDLGRARYLLGISAKIRGELEQATLWLRKADEVFTALDIPSLHSSTLHELGAVARRAGRVEEAEALYADAARISASVGRSTDATVSEIERVMAALRRGALDGLQPGLELLIRSLSRTGATDRAAHATVFLAQVRYACGDREGADRALEEALQVLEQGTNLYGLLALLMERGYHEATRGDLDASGESLAAARAAAAKGEDHEHQVKVAAIEAQRRCFAGEPEAAARAARDAIGLARARAEPTINATLVLRLAEASVYGLPSELVEEAAGLLAAQAEALPPLQRLAAAAVEGAACLGRPAAQGGPLHTTASVFRDPRVGERQAELRIVGDFFEAEALRREGERQRARETATKARVEAASLAHVWLELALLRILHRLDPDGGYAKEARSLIARAAGPEHHDRLLAAWQTRDP